MLQTDAHNAKQVITTHEQRMNQALLQQRKNISKINKAIKYLDSKDPSVVVKGLNVLTAKTFETSDSNAIHLENFPELTLSLGCLLDVLSPWAGLVASKEPLSYGNLVLNNEDVWAPINMPIDYSRVKLSLTNDNPLLLTVLNIIRNLSFEAANEFLLTSSFPIMAHLIGIVYASVLTHLVTETTQLAFDTLVHVGGRIDTTGRKRNFNWLYIDDGKLPEDKLKSLNLLRYSEHMSSVSSPAYAYVTTLLFPILSYIISNVDNSVLSTSKSFHRYMIVRGIELLSKLASTAENALALSKMPDIILDKIVSMLCVNQTLSEGITSDSHFGDPLGRSKPPALTFLPSSQSGGNGNNILFVSDFCADLELRDLAIDAIGTLSSCSTLLAARFAETPNCIEFIYRISVSPGSNIATNTNSNNTGSSYNSYAGNMLPSRTEGNLKAVQILSTLLSVPEVSEKFFTIRSNLYVASCSDEAVADVVCNKAALVYQWVVAQPPALPAVAVTTEGGLSSHPSGVFSI